MRRRGNIRCTPHEKKHTCTCEWCAVSFAASREYAATCSAACRMRLHLFVKRAGYTPLRPPGPITTSEALAQEVDRLFALERQRRIEKRIDEIAAAEVRLSAESKKLSKTTR